MEGWDSNSHSFFDNSNLYLVLGSVTTFIALSLEYWNELQWVVSGTPWSSRTKRRPSVQSPGQLSASHLPGPVISWRNRYLGTATFTLLSVFSHWVVPSSASPWTAARQASPSFTVYWSWFKLMSIELMLGRRWGSGETRSFHTYYAPDTTSCFALRSLNTSIILWRHGQSQNTYLQPRNSVC